MPYHHHPVLAGLTLAAAMSLGLPAAAQQASDSTPVCGGDAQWLEGDGSQDIAASPAALSAQAQVAGGQQALFAFRTGAASQALRVEASASDGDPAITLLTEDGDVIAENDDTPVSLNSALETTVGPGVYCVAVRSVGNSAMSATVQVSRPEQAALLPQGGDDAGIDRIAACTPDTPAESLVQGVVDERLGQGALTATQDGTQTGYYRFSLAQGMSLTLRAASPTLDPMLRLYDAQGTLLGENDDADGLNSRLDFATALTPGDYCVAVAALSAQPGELTVSAEKLDVEAFLRNAYRKGELSPPADGSHPIQAVDLAQVTQTVVLHDGATQWLGFDLDQPTVIIINAFGGLVGADPRLVLFAASGAVAGENDDVDGGTDARLGPVLLEPGRYHLGVVDVGRNDGSAGPIRPIGLTFDRFLRAE